MIQSNLTGQNIEIIHQDPKCIIEDETHLQVEQPKGYLQPMKRKHSS